MKHTYNEVPKTALMVSGDKEKFLQKIPNLKCDIAILNLEDGVYDKRYARNLVCKYISKYQKEGIKTPKLVVRINDINSIDGKEDIKALNQVDARCVRVPKIKSVEDVKRALDLTNPQTEVHLSLETKEAFADIKSLKIDNRVTTLYLGILDLLESMRLPQSLLTLHNPTIEYILSKYLVDSKSAGFLPFSFVFQEYQDTQLFKKWLQKEYSMGFVSKACISPKQVELTNKIFDSSDEIDRARYIIKIFEEHRDRGITGFSDEKYGYIDEPIYKDALNILL
jgi:citrate lyase subunit beta/citryl-CoA lyase